LRLNATPRKCSENQFAVSARMQKFVGAEHRCRPGLEAFSQATNTIYGLSSGRIRKPS
jgi:hypothetical protein